MIPFTRIEADRARRRGVVALQVAVSSVVLLGFAALTIDMGRLYVARGDLQRSADAAALAGASVYTTDLMMAVRQGLGGEGAIGYVVDLAETKASEYALVNRTLGEPTSIDSDDLVTGWINLGSGNDTIHTNPVPKDYNAVGVYVKRTDGGTNGPVNLLFAPIFGKPLGETTALAVAVFDDRFSGFSLNGFGAAMLPFTVSEQAFEQDLANGGDEYGYDSPAEAVYSGSDGIREIRLYPYPLSGTDYEEGDGNFGVLNIGTGNQGLQALNDQIINGVPPEDMVMEVGTSDMTFFDDGGSPVTYEITGSPGLDGGLAASIESLEGQVIGFFLHNGVILSGANAIYTITQVRFGRVMELKLTGPPDQRGFYVQPVTYDGAGVSIDVNAPSTNGLIGKVVLFK
ncbi:MAG: hypothetical protein IIB61_00545 [Planctomycetes bacterium]|nr:hypothetical protein [Planctomycetota bacterium]